ncbi:MAG TPA: CHAD domain-containing protein [Solirubrobacterales bacterium]|nr:CHAD domain-containing protein [Solirubrobacterales bacterium]
MSSEIERKFLLGELPSWLAERAGERISQGYLTNGEGPEIRLRRAGERNLLTVKTGSGEVREELEVELDPELFRTLWPLTADRRVTKTRWREPLGEGREAEVDAYVENLAGLVVAEVEFSSTEESREFEPPSWLGKEITDDARYANRELAMNEAPPVEEPEQKDEPSRAFRLKRKEEVGEGLVRVIRGRAAKAIEALREDAKEDPVAAIHAARKDIKKIRSVLRLLRAELGGKLYRSENERYREAGRALSGSRDAAVKVETLTALEERFGHGLPSASAWNWKRVLERERREADATDSEAIEDAVGALEGGREAAAKWSLDGSWELFGPGLEKAYEQGRRAMARVAEDADPELVHEWRKRAKDLWYDLRLVRRAWPELLEPSVDRVHALTDLLGDHHDLTVLGEDLASRPRIGSKAKIGALIEERQAELLDEALDLGARLYAEKPKAFGKRIQAYWAAWR